MSPFFSIIVPCCDVAPYLRECLDSVIKQSFSDWECLLGVETSKDNTEEIAREYEAKDPRFKVFTGPRSGSCSASRNTGIDMAAGEYIIFLDGDDTIVEGSLQRLHDKIAARPGADLYPCAIKVHNDMTGKDEALRDNYPSDVEEEMTGPEATICVANFKKHPEPMMQLTVCRRQFLLENNLKCIYGISGQDREFTPRALYTATHVVPTHEPFYVYRKRVGAITNSLKTAKRLPDQAIIHKSLLAFHAHVNHSPEFDKRVASCWSRNWISWMFYIWFDPHRMKTLPRDVRYKTMGILFSDGFDNFNLLLKSSPLPRRIAGWWFCAFMKIPRLQFAAELFFKCYFLLSRTTKSQQ